MLIVEDGSKPVGANSYLSVEDATNYINMFADNSAWPDDQPSQEQALIVACQALELNWGPQYASMRIVGTQSLLWPRYNFYDRNMRFVAMDAIPPEIKQAQAELALAYCNGEDLFPNDSLIPNTTMTRVRVGGQQGIEQESQYVAGTKFSYFKKIDAILRPVVRGKQATRLTR